MTINSVTEMWSRKTSSEQSTDGRSFSVTYQSAYQVEHSVDATQDEIRYASGVPAIRSTYPGTDYVYATQKQVETVGPIFSIVSVTWAGEVADAEGGNPIDMQTGWKMNSVVTQEEVDHDGYGLPLTNVNGEPVTGLTKDVWDWQLTVTKNFDAFNTYTLNAYANAVNSDFYGPPGNLWPPGTAKLQGISIEPSDNIGLGFIKASMTVLFRTPYNTSPIRSWWWRYRNEGVYERVGTRVSFAAPGGAGNTATGYAVANAGGAITGIAVTNRGSGYSIAPTVTITSDTGGSGATATATLDSNGGVASVSVGAGGSGYKSKIVRAVDDNKDPITQPLLLAADGSRLANSGSAVFLERPRYSFYLPFSALGFVF